MHLNSESERRQLHEYYNSQCTNNNRKTHPIHYVTKLQNNYQSSQPYASISQRYLIIPKLVLSYTSSRRITSGAGGVIIVSSLTLADDSSSINDSGIPGLLYSRENRLGLEGLAFVIRDGEGLLPLKGELGCDLN